MKSQRFGLIGAAGYVAPKHMQAMKDTGSELVTLLDKSDSAGIVDSYFPKADFFTEFERFDRHVDLLRRSGKPLDYISICSPNYLHDSHIRFALRSGANVICEKPLVLNPWNIDGLIEAEKGSGCRVSTILQLRLHESVIELKNKIASSAADEIFDVDLTYITSRGSWYFQSWKGDIEKSGGIATNIGVHFFDMLHFVFGELKGNTLHLQTPSAAGGYIEYERARVRWFLSIDESHLPDEIRQKGVRTFRNISIGEEEFEFSGGFTDLHTRSYEAVLDGRGFSLEDNRVAIDTVAEIRKLEPNLHIGEVHPIVDSLVV
ncbi:MAG: Gfo/Idh/MocA family oxidoreductase [Gammaproteobacteria bacterium]